MTKVERLQKKCKTLFNKLHRIGKQIDPSGYKTKYWTGWPIGWIQNCARDLQQLIEWTSLNSVPEECKIHDLKETIYYTEETIKQMGY